MNAWHPGGKPRALVGEGRPSWFLVEAGVLETIVVC